MERSGRPLSREGRFDSPFIRGYLAVLESIIDQTGAFMGVDDSHRHSVTLKDIAAMADVSSMTVSNFINGKFHAMSAETREKLGKILQKYPYRPHGSARNLRLSRAFSIGLVVVDDSPHFLTRQVIGSIIAGLATELNDNGYSLTVPGRAPFRHGKLSRASAPAHGRALRGRGGFWGTTRQHCGFLCVAGAAAGSAADGASRPPGGCLRPPHGMNTGAACRLRENASPLEHARSSDPPGRVLAVLQHASTAHRV